jgi:hypothetical protein
MGQGGDGSRRREQTHPVRVVAIAKVLEADIADVDGHLLGVIVGATSLVLVVIACHDEL